MIKSSSIRMNITNVQRLAKIESTFENDKQQSEETKKKRLADYAAKKAKKEQVIVQSIIMLDVKLRDDETDLNAMEQSVRSIEADDLVWG
ncbi:unnamed protein product [Rotaria sordida]|uniref:Translation elongation factor EF1B beta/delta subunit guanine nucleotide exchange domain-containing protein n=1 Tax=Rotaria sordida TaxID=392033 RepID=A0A815REL8_9BILA|nr:unnamed protein product [Rotaria sordida]